MEIKNMYSKLEEIHISVEMKIAKPGWWHHALIEDEDDADRGKRFMRDMEQAMALRMTLVPSGKRKII